MTLTFFQKRIPWPDTEHGKKKGLKDIIKVEPEILHVNVKVQWSVVVASNDPGKITIPIRDLAMAPSAQAEVKNEKDDGVKRGRLII